VSHQTLLPPYPFAPPTNRRAKGLGHTRLQQGSLIPRPFFATQRKIGLVNGLFHSRSLRRNVGGPIRLGCESDVIHGNNGNKESGTIEAVCRTLGYAGLKSDHEKAIGVSRKSGCVQSLSTMNGQFKCQQDWSRVSIAERGVSF